MVGSPFDEQFAEDTQTTVNSKMLLVAGDSRFGGLFAGALRARGHDVWTLWEKHGEGLRNRCVLADPLEPTQIVSAVAHWVAEGVVFNGFCSCVQFDYAVHELKIFDLQSHFTVNVFNPLTLLLYLAEFKVLSPGARAVFCVGKDIGSASYRSSQLALEPTVRACLQDVDFPYERFFIHRPDEGALEHVCHIFLGESPLPL